MCYTKLERLSISNLDVSDNIRKVFLTEDKFLALFLKLLPLILG